MNSRSRTSTRFRALRHFIALVTVPLGACSMDTTSPSDAQVDLWVAAESGDVVAARHAFSAGADVNALDTRTNTNGRRALNYAAINNRPAMIRWLVENGADVNRPNNSGFTPLHHAAESGSVEAVVELLKLGADSRAQLPSGTTPLGLARQRGHSAVIEVLASASP